ncbi:RNA polymerase sigma-54 factor [Sphingomonas ginsenosidimutans]|jgi:RNA polymerase sigma-54 factor|uniref:RNA polymerase sigma-54 factor n=1 Tax=Sphingomonas ginsenosidimutans TaxID=862134 RepID=A0A2A4HZM2_9SPHN|nr:RNA polymerase factor sigma-54 [Sphingomonas ginsenosidimutans]MEE2916668.1 RNA polymerase factor sigma-54 [Pseudomonadota bacterium]PCG09135.1 RNA polymerase sigma-54 factor [Sphingomonas ginsenosidimutans]
MSLAPRLDLRQSQSLVMTPQLQQAIKLLTLSNLEIEGVIAEEIEKNPLLETAPAAGDAPATAPADAPAPARDEPAGADELVMAGEGAGESLDVDIAAERFDDGPGDHAGPSAGATGSGSASGEAVDFDSFADTSESLADVLLAQAGAAFAGADLLIARALIDQIDEAGYLRADLIDISQRLGVPLRHVETVLAGIQRFEPTGVGARDLAECLAIQAREADRYDPCMARLIDHLDWLARGDLPRLKRLCGVDDEDLADMIRELRGYDPKPGCRFGGDAPMPVIPDLTVVRTRDGWAIEMNSATLPRVLVNRRYYGELSAGPQDKGSKAWLAEKLASANWLVKALDQRQRTIIRVATEIVKQQEAFFLKGVAHLKPLTLRQVAEAIEMHESTVSRVTSNKYLSCARGLFELKYFFTSAIQAADGGDAVSAEAVKSAIRALIASEGDTILSDDTLVEMLNAKGFGIARRTVAKYREAMGIGSSVQRRRAKALQGA